MSVSGTSRVATSVPSGEGHAHVRACANNRFEALAGRLIAVPAVRARVVRGEE